MIHNVKHNESGSTIYRASRERFKFGQWIRTDSGKVDILEQKAKIETK